MLQRSMAVVSLLILPALSGCATQEKPPIAGLTAFVGGTLIDGTENGPIDDAVLVVRDGRIEAVGSSDQVTLPEGAHRVDLSGKILVPGLVVGHAHVGVARGLETGEGVYSEANIERQLRLYAHYGVTTVVSLGGDGREAVAVRDAQNDPTLNRARLFIAGAIVPPQGVEAARKTVQENAAMKVDFIKIRVDDNLGTTPKMPPEVYTAAIEEAHRLGLPVAAHLFYLEDAKLLLRAGTDFLAHSVRDQEVDDELVDLLNKRNVCLCPTLTRELSTFAYEDVPEFFEDPYFLEKADPKVLEQLKDPKRQNALRNSSSAQAYKKALEMASKNLKRLADGGVRIVMGTDSGPPGRFQGYFEHVEMEMMQQAGLNPGQVIRAATGNAARCLKLADVGTLQPGKWADFLVLRDNPLLDIKNLRSIESVWIAGNHLP